MTSFSRRNLLQLFAASASAAAVASGSVVARGDGAPVPIPWPTPRRVLEIFLRGGASCWGSFWRDDELGGDLLLPEPAGTQDVSFSSWSLITGGAVPPANLVWRTRSMGQAAGPLFRTYATPAGPRKLANHMRIIRMGHALEPHELAIPYAITGTTLGRPSMFGLGAAISKHVGLLGTRPIPRLGVRSLIFQTGTDAYDSLAANYAATYGVHGASHQPPIIPLGNMTFYDALLRPGLKDSDALKTFYRSRYEVLLKKGGIGDTTRSAGWSSYQAAFDALVLRSQSIHDLLDDHSTRLFTPPAVVDYHAHNLTREAIRAAVDLLATGQLDHAAVIDGGVEKDYDTHNGSVTATFADNAISAAAVQNGNIWNVCDTLANHISQILDNNITVVINTEFGRKEKLGANTGTEHHTPGYVNVVLSKLITSPAFVGGIDAVDDSVARYVPGCVVGPSGTAPASFLPTDVHAALASLVGMDPWGAGMYDGGLSCLGTGSTPATTLLGV